MTSDDIRNLTLLQLAHVHAMTNPSAIEFTFRSDDACEYLADACRLASDCMSHFENDDVDAFSTLCRDALMNYSCDALCPAIALLANDLD